MGAMHRYDGKTRPCQAVITRHASQDMHYKLTSRSEDMHHPLCLLRIIATIVPAIAVAWVAAMGVTAMNIVVIRSTTARHERSGLDA